MMDPLSSPTIPKFKSFLVENSQVPSPKSNKLPMKPRASSSLPPSPFYFNSNSSCARTCGYSWFTRLMLTLIDQPLALEHQKICMTLQHNICKTYRYKGTEPG